MTLPKTQLDREYQKFRDTGENGKTKVAVVQEQGPYNPINVSMDAEDNFGRLKVAAPHLLFDSSFQYSLQTKVFIQDLIGGATITHNSSRACATISCSATAGSRARFRTRNYFPYSPAFTNSVMMSFCFQNSLAGITKRVGMYDEKNGYIFEMLNGNLRFGVRSSISGSAITNYAEQVNWNVDNFDGSGNEASNPSGILIDKTKQQILFIDYQWLGSGTVFVGFVIDGKKYPAHKFHHANLINSLYSQTGTLPIQAEILNVSGLASYFEFTCCSVVSNGATAQHGHLHSVSSGIIGKNMPVSGTSYPIISIRKKPAYSDVPVQILDLHAFSTSQDDFLMQIVHKPTLVGVVWVDIPNSLCQKDVSATSWSGGDIVAEFYMKGNLQASEKLELISKFWDLTLGNDFSGNSEIMAITAIPLTQQATLYGVINFKEFE